MNDDQWRAPGREPGGPVPRVPDGSAPPHVPQPPASSGDSSGMPPAAGNPYPPAGPGGPYPPGPPRSANPYASPRPGAGPPHPAGAFATSDRHRERVLGGSGYDSPAYRNDTAAVAAMVLGIIGIPVPGVGLLAIAFGHLGLHRLRTSYEGGRGLAVAGLVMGYVMTVIWLGVLLVVLTLRSLL